jgi:hypothetical protein
MIEYLALEISKLKDPEIYHHAIVNPSGYYRIQILNITIPNLHKYDNYVLLLQRGSELTQIQESYYADIYELNKMSNSPQKVRKVFFILPMDALSDSQLYIIRSSGENDCSVAGIKCAKKITEKSVTGPIELSNNAITVNINKDGNLDHMEFKANNASEDFTESLTYYNTRSKTRSGLYLFNPRHPKKVIDFASTDIHVFDIGGMLKLVQVFKQNGSERLLKNYIVNHDGCPNLKKQLFMEVHIDSDRIAEISLVLTKKHKASDSTHKAYADDSMKMVERPIYDKNSKIPHSHESELEGYYTSACVHGGALRETYKQSGHKDSFFGWANSSPLGCTFSDKGEISFMIFRSIGHSDYKGVSDTYKDEHINSISFQFYVDSSVEGAMFHKVRANTKLNEPYGIFSRALNAEDFVNLPISSNLMKDFIKFNSGSAQLSSNFGDVNLPFLINLD